MKKAVVMCLLVCLVSTVHANLAMNGGFESMSGDPVVPDSWTLYKGNGATVYFAAKTDVVYEGGYSEKVAARNGYGMIHQTLSSGFAPGETLRFWLYAHGDTNGAWQMDEPGDQVDVFVKFMDAGGSRIGDEIGMVLFDADETTAAPILLETEWLQSAVFNFVVPQDTASLMIKIRSVDGSVDGGTTDGTGVYLDNVTLVPEPATMALLGLGGLVGLRRRRA